VAKSLSRAVYGSGELRISARRKTSTFSAWAAVSRGDGAKPTVRL